LGAGLYGLLRSRSSDLTGILNGIDTSLWNPATDEMLFENYDVHDLSGKAVSKRKLQEKLGLDPSESAPLFGCVARLDPQKGFDLVLEIAPRMLEEGAQLAILGSGWEEYVRGFRELEKEYPKQLSMNEGFQAALAPKIYAGSDFFLMPSRFEPCGLGQMIALRYGTIPVVRRTGGLADTIVDLDDDAEGGNGFSFTTYKASVLLETVRRARSHFDGPTWKKLVERAMQSDFSWARSVVRYLEVYERAISKSRRG
jgi:starch synthase